VFLWLKYSFRTKPIFSEINECEGMPCVNGTCEDLIGAYSCVCVAGYTGQNCSIGWFNFAHNTIKKVNYSGY